MHRATTLFAVLAMAALTVPAAAARLDPDARLAKALAGRVAGKPVSCINLRTIQSSDVIDGKAILYRTSGNRLYLNAPRSGAGSLDDDDILVTRTPSSQLCNLDLVTLVDRTSGFPQGTVSLGEFIPYTKDAAR